jgi:hypothetical protein
MKVFRELSHIEISPVVVKDSFQEFGKSQEI